MCDKVFCVNCQYFNGCKKATPCNTTYDADNIHEQCNAPKNIRATYKSDESDKYISTPAIINKFNNCGWFIAKGLDQDIHYLLNKHNIDPESHEPILKLIRELSRRLTIVENASESSKLEGIIKDIAKISISGGDSTSISEAIDAIVSIVSSFKNKSAEEGSSEYFINDFIN